MDLQLRHEFCEKMEGQADKYGLEGIGSEAFTLQYGYRQRYSAADVIFAMVALLESTVSHKFPLFIQKINHILDFRSRERRRN
jgi:cell division control protein 45